MGLDGAVISQTKICGDAFETLGGGFDGKTDFAVAGVKTEIEQERCEPIASEWIIVAGKNGLDAGGVVGAGSEIRADEQPIAGTGGFPARRGSIWDGSKLGSIPKRVIMRASPECGAAPKSWGRSSAVARSHKRGWQGISPTALNAAW